MLLYIVKLILLVPLVGGLAWGSLWLWKRAQAGLLAQSQAGDRRLRLVNSISLGPQVRIALVEVDGRTVLIGQSRAGLVALGEGGDV